MAMKKCEKHENHENEFLMFFSGNLPHEQLTDRFCTDFYGDLGIKPCFIGDYTIAENG